MSTKMPNLAASPFKKCYEFLCSIRKKSTAHKYSSESLPESTHHKSNHAFRNLTHQEANESLNDPPHQKSDQNPPHQKSDQNPPHQKSDQNPPHQKSNQNPPHQKSDQNPTHQKSNQAPINNVSPISSKEYNPLLLTSTANITYHLPSNKVAYKRGIQAARFGSVIPDISTLMHKNKYDEYEASAYIEGYYKAAGNEFTQQIRRAKRAGNQAALMGYNLLSVNQLKRKNYTKAQIDAYYEAYHKAAGTLHEQIERRIRLSAYQAAKYGCKMPTIEKLKSKLYTPEQIDIYYEAFNKAAGSEKEQMIRRLKRFAYQLSRKNLPLPSKAELVKKGFDASVIDLILDNKLP
jgi:hypothetical protein